MAIRPIPIRDAVLAAKVEGTFGTAETLAAINTGFRVMNPVLKPTGSSIVIPASVGNADIAAVPGRYNGDLSFDVQLYGGSWAAVFLPACGFAVSSGTWSFTDDHSVWKGLTAGLFYGSAKKCGIYGAMGSFNLRLPAGDVGVGSFRYKGVYKANPGTLPTGITWDTSLPPVFAAANALTVDGGTAINCGTLEVVADDYAILIPSPNVAGAYVNAWLRKPNFRIRIDPHATSSKDWFADWLASDEIVISAVVNGGSGNTITVSATVQQVTVPDHQEVDEQLVTPLEFAVMDNSLAINIA